MVRGGGGGGGEELAGLTPSFRGVTSAFDSFIVEGYINQKTRKESYTKAIERDVRYTLSLLAAGSVSSLFTSPPLMRSESRILIFSGE